jgi:hypothetical protein
MPYWACTACHHEWEGSKDESQCDWCKANGYILEPETPLEKVIKNLDKIVPNVVQSRKKGKRK